MKIFIRKQRGYTILELLTTLFIIAALASIMIPNLRRAIFKAHMSGCMSNVRNLATALQVYSNDNDAHYPDTLSRLTPQYISIIPTCQSVNADTYTPGYVTSDDLRIFTLHCKGNNHQAVGFQPDEPYFDMSTGLNPR